MKAFSLASPPRPRSLRATLWLWVSLPPNSQLSHPGLGTCCALLLGHLASRAGSSGFFSEGPLLPVIVSHLPLTWFSCPVSLADVALSMCSFPCSLTAPRPPALCAPWPEELCLSSSLLHADPWNYAWHVVSAQKLLGECWISTMLDLENQIGAIVWLLLLILVKKTEEEERGGCAPGEEE